MEALVAELGCRIGSLPTTYLGLPLGTGDKSLSIWDNIEERQCKRIVLWKRSFISKGEGIIMINNTLANLQCIK